MDEERFIYTGAFGRPPPITFGVYKGLFVEPEFQTLPIHIEEKLLETVKRAIKEESVVDFINLCQNDSNKNTK